MKPMLNLPLTRYLALAVLLGLFLFASAAWVQAASQSGFEIGWWTVDGGGGRLANSGYVLNSTAGQPDAGPALANGGYSLYGGFWYRAARYKIMLPVVMRTTP